MVEWVCGDALLTPFPARSFNLVSMHYPALPKAAGGAAVRTLLDTVRPGGLLLAVYHDLGVEHREHMKSQGVDAADYISADDLGRLLGDDFTVELHAVEPRATRRAAPRRSATSSCAPGVDDRATGSVRVRAPGATERRILRCLSYSGGVTECVDPNIA